MTIATIQQGTCRGSNYTNLQVTLLSAPRMGKNGWFVSARNEEIFGDRNVRVSIDCPEKVQIGAEAEAAARPVELSDQEIMDKMRDKFGAIEGISRAAVDGYIRALIIAGPAGVGKSHGIENTLNEQRLINKLSGSDAVLSMEKVAHASPLGLYQLLWEFRRPGSVLVLDDSDGLLYDDTCINMFKAVTDSGKKRRLTWRTESKVLEERGIDTEFEFEGSVIFITNLDFENARGKIGEHLKAIVSRCHYIDVDINSTREKLLRCKQIIGDGMLDRYKFEDWQCAEIVKWLEANQDRLREISLRTVVKAADLAKMDWRRWTSFAEQTLLRGSF